MSQSWFSVIYSKFSDSDFVAFFIIPTRSVAKIRFHFHSSINFTGITAHRFTKPPIH